MPQALDSKLLLVDWIETTNEWRQAGKWQLCEFWWGPGFVMLASDNTDREHVIVPFAQVVSFGVNPEIG